MDVTLTFPNSTMRSAYDEKLYWKSKYGGYKIMNRKSNNKVESFRGGEFILKKVLLLLLSTLVGILSGCSAGKLSVPSGILATDQTVADEYMTDNSFLTARYGSDYTVTFVGGSGEGEVNQSGKSGIMSFQYMINDTDLYDVEVVKENMTHGK